MRETIEKEIKKKEQKAVMKEEMKAKREEKDKERLFNWVPDARKKPISNKFVRMMDRYMNPEKRYKEKTNKRKEVDNAWYENLLCQKTAENALTM